MRDPTVRCRCAEPRPRQTIISTRERSGRGSVSLVREKEAFQVADHLRFGPLSHCAHLCVDMQRLFHEQTPWHAPWVALIIPSVVQLVDHAPRATIFSRFLPLPAAAGAPGTWQRYYERWSCMTLKAIDPDLVEIVAPLALHIPPSIVVDKTRYSPWMETNLHGTLQERGVNTLIVSGAETDVCVAASVLGAVDLGYRVVIPADAVCSSSNEGHEAMLSIYRQRFSMQVELACVAEVLEAWSIS
jgi:nicotinamidase-related amidase